MKIICSKLPKLKIQPKDIKQYFTFFINITVSNPEFSSQSKTKLVATKSNLSCEFMNRQINAVLKWSFIKDIEETNKIYAISLSYRRVLDKVVEKLYWK